MTEQFRGKKIINFNEKKNWNEIKTKWKLKIMKITQKQNNYEIIIKKFIFWMVKMIYWKGKKKNFKKMNEMNKKRKILVIYSYYDI